MNTPFTIAILAFDEVEALDLAGPYEVFTTAARMAARPEAEAWPRSALVRDWQVRTVARTRHPVRARAGLRILPDLAFDECPSAGLLLVPGGIVDAVARCPATLDWVRRVHAGAALTASVCTGVFVLATAGVARTGRVTTHWEDIDALRRQWPNLQVAEGVRWVEDGRVLSSAGISAGIDMALYLVSRLASPALAERTARQMDYRWLRHPA
ncbi:MAG: DJ-1/PfpI family protein [Hydrogenophaga sp.]